ncbi:MAG TPA: galactose oxidase-like domain-containing protein, partial [Solirubrobacteraceae bacterium]|nr:galactose oxidase-like domain-containing protein [Solirubrobacteraceae bacterium]
ALLFAPTASWGHGGVSGRLTERELVRAETRLLGAEHAAEHASVRRFERRARARWLLLSPTQRRRVAARRERATARAAQADNPTADGTWNGQFAIPVAGTHAALLPTGKVLWFNRVDGNDPVPEAAAYLWDPSKRVGDPAALRSVPPPVNPDTGLPVNLFCAGQSLLADGQLLVTGGNLAFETATTDWKGLNRVYTFNPWTEQWAEQPRMAHGRWYPTQTLLPDGRTMIVFGRDETGTRINPEIELFTPPATRGGQGTVTKIGDYGPSLAGSPVGPQYYPHWFVMPSGNLLNTGPAREESWVLRLTGSTLTSEDRPLPQREHFYGTGVMLPGGPQGSTRVAQIGGFGWPGNGANTPAGRAEASPITEIFDEAQPTAAPVSGPSLAQARAHHNTVLLPDGSMVTVGGGYGSRGGTLRTAGPEHKPIEIWNPATNTWRLGPAQAYKRAYHSTALLLPDARVVSAGDDGDPTKDPARRTDVAELYEPSYLFAPGPRPAITAAPETLLWNQPFSVQTSSAITRAVLVAPGATTHANDMSQRHVELRITPNRTGADLVAPPDANVAPPGWYMLFGLSATGKPSVARWVALGAPGAPGTGGSNAPANRAPVLRRLTVKPRAFKAGKKGARVRYRASEAAVTTFKVKRVASGVRRGGRCKPRRGRSGRRCTRLVGVSGNWRHRAAAGLNALRFRGRVGDVRLRPGRYRLTATAKDAAGAKSRAVHAPFTIMKR